MAAKVLVTYATRHGATKGIAQAVGSVLHSCGHQVRVLPAGIVQSLDGYDAVVVGSAVYHDQWLWDARRLLRRLRGELRHRPVWLFSSGPLGGTPYGEERLQREVGLDAPVPPFLRRSVESIDLRGHAMFGGRLDAKVAAGLDTYVPHGDWRDMAAVREWARRIGAEIAAQAGADARHAAARRLAAGLPSSRSAALAEKPALEPGWGRSLGRI